MEGSVSAIVSRHKIFKTKLRKCKGCIIDASIPKLMQIHGKNVIVVDGFNFYGMYIYPKFNWVCGAIRELVEEVCNFVEAFKQIGVKLVFFFAEGHLDEGSDRLGSPNWFSRHSGFVEYTSTLFHALSQKRKIYNIESQRDYYYTPLDAQSVVLFTLRHLLNCEVHLIYSGDRCDAAAYYTRNNQCLGLLAQDYFYLYYQGICHLSFNKLKLNSMTTVQYCPEELARQEDLVGLLMPIFFHCDLEILPQLKKILVDIGRKVEECESVDISREKIMEFITGKEIQEVFNVDFKPTKGANAVCRVYAGELLRYKFGFNYIKVHGPLKKWELIRLRAQELYASGQMSNRLQYILMHNKYYNHCILEDFVELPPSSLMYGHLRRKLYGVLFHEATEHYNENIETEENPSQETPALAAAAAAAASDDDYLQPGARNIWSKKLPSLYPNVKPLNCDEVREWCMSKTGCSEIPLTVTPDVVDPTLHPGLLTLWNFNNVSPDIQDIKWKLFVSCISARLDYLLLRRLPPTLVVPTVVLFYMYHEVPHIFKTKPWKFLKPWEVEVFIAQAVMVQQTSVESISQINIENINSRVVKLIASFIYGCHTMRLLVQACGGVVSDYDLSLWHFFDGKLLHSFYEKAEWRCSAAHLCSRESFINFQNMKQIVLPNIPDNSRRM